MNRHTLSLALIVVGMLVAAIGLYEFFVDRDSGTLPLAAGATLMAAGAVMRRKAGEGDK